MHVLIVDTLQPDDSPGPSIAAFRTYELRGHAVTPVPDTTTCAWTCWSRGLFRICPPRPRGSWGLGRRVPPWGPLWGPIHRGRRVGGRRSRAWSERGDPPAPVSVTSGPSRAYGDRAASACGPRRADERTRRRPQNDPERRNFHSSLSLTIRAAHPSKHLD